MVQGPFRSFRHEHLFEPAGAGSRMIDVVTFRMALGPITERPVGLYLRRLLRIRGAAIRSAAITSGDGDSRG